MRTSLTLIALVFSVTAYAQMLGGSAFMQNSEVEVGINECGVFATDTTPAGYNGNSGFPPGLGIVWTRPGGTFMDDFCGDAFLPGSPEEGFQFSSDETGVLSNRQTSCVGSAGFGAGPDFPGSIANYYDGASVKAVRWTGGRLGLRLTQTVVTFDDYPVVVAKVQMCNGTGMDLNNAYYARSWDPDPDQAWAGTFTSQHRVVRQPPISGDAMVAAQGTSISDCSIAAVSVDSRARASFGSFFPTNPADMWAGNPPYSNSGSNIADEANQLSWNLGTLADGDCDCVAWAWFFSEDDASAARSASNLACDLIPDAITTDAEVRQLLDAVSFESLKGEINAFPNPTSDFFQVDLRDFDAELIRVYDMSGRLVYQTQVTNAIEMVSTDGWTPGLYTVTAEGNGSVRTSRISVQ